MPILAVAARLLDEVAGCADHPFALAEPEAEPAIWRASYRCGRPMIVDEAELERLLGDTFDQAVVYHGFTDYMRDYEVVFYCTADPVTGIAPAHLRYLFKYCVSAQVETAISSSVWRQSLDERLIDYEAGVDLPGYVWGVKRQDMYPGATVVDDSQQARRWGSEVGIPFHEVLIEANGHKVRLVFSDLSVTEVEDGYTPHRLGPGGPDHKIPFLPPEGP